MNIIIFKMTLFLIAVLIGSVFIYRFSNKIAAWLEDWFEEHEELQNHLKSIKNFLYKALITIFGLWIAISVGIATLEATFKYYSSFKTEHQRRIKFLEVNCYQIDQGYEILNNGKLTYKCPNGKTYKE